MKKVVSHIAIILGSAMIAIAIMLPTFLVPRQKVIPLDTVSTTITDIRDAALLDSSALANNQPVKGRENDPRCEDEENLPVHCFINENTPLRSNRYVHIIEPADGEVATLNVGTTITRQDREEPESLVNATVDQITLDRKGFVPVDEPISVTHYHHPSQPGAGEPVEYTRPGVQYLFPMNTEKRAYEYYDIVGQMSQPIEFMGEEEQSGERVYKYEMVIEPQNLYENFKAFSTADGRKLTKADQNYLASLRLTMPAEKWGLEGDEEVTMDRYYANVRTVRVEPTTGQIVNGTEHIFQYYAEDDEDARRIAGPDRAKEERERNRTAMDFVAQWDEPSRDSQLSSAMESANLLRLAGRTIPMILGIVGAIILILGIIGLISTRRSERYAVVPE